MGLLNKFQNPLDAKLTQDFKDLQVSLVDAFEGRVNVRHAEIFHFGHDGLTSVDLKLDLVNLTIKVSIQGKAGIDYNEGEKIGLNPSQEVLQGFVSRYSKLRYSWTLGLGQYNYMNYSTTISALTNDFLHDLVKIMELAGYVPKRKGSSVF
jgi:hypothetical protein